LSLYQIYLTEL